MANEAKAKCDTKHATDSTCFLVYAHRANTIDVVMADELIATMKQLEDDPQVRGIVLGSSVAGIFSAGLHLPSMIIGADGSTDDLATYWTRVQKMWLALYTTPLATVAAMPGHCIAGGCMLSLACDVRVLVDSSKCKMGLNETQFGLVAPPWLARMVVDVAGRRPAETLLQRGLLVPPEEALRLGLVDQTVPLSRVAEEARARLAELLAVPDGARASVKQQLRHEAADALREHMSEDLDAFVSLVEKPSVQQQLISHIDGLKNKDKGK